MPRIVPYPHPALRYPSRPVERIDDELRSTVRTMFDLMYAARGSAWPRTRSPCPFRFFVLNPTADPEQKDLEQVFINPVIVKRHSTIEDEEGCLSLPGLYANVTRARKIRVKAFNLQGEEIEVEAEDLLSGRRSSTRLDHLDGKLFIDYLGLISKTKFYTKIRDFEKRIPAGTPDGRPLPPGRRGSTLRLRAAVAEIWNSPSPSRCPTSPRPPRSPRSRARRRLTSASPRPTARPARATPHGADAEMPEPSPAGKSTRILMLGTGIALPTFVHLCSTGHNVVGLIIHQTWFSSVQRRRRAVPDAAGTSRQIINNERPRDARGKNLNRAPLSAHRAAIFPVFFRGERPSPAPNNPSNCDAL
ncbi:MAG: peptide deformylase [Isosphaeraceae bacterium]